MSRASFLLQPSASSDPARGPLHSRNRQPTVHVSRRVARRSRGDQRAHSPFRVECTLQTVQASYWMVFNLLSLLSAPVDEWCFFSVAADSCTGHIVFLWTNDIIFVQIWLFARHSKKPQPRRRRRSGVYTAFSLPSEQLLDDWLYLRHFSLFLSNKNCF